MEEIKGQEMTVFMPTTEDIGNLESFDKKRSIQLKYKSVEDWVKGEEIKAYYLGIKEIPNDKNELIKCGVFASKDETFLAGQMLIVDAVKDLTTGTPVSIIYEGKKKNKSTEGSTCAFDVSILGK